MTQISPLKDFCNLLLKIGFTHEIYKHYIQHLMGHILHGILGKKPQLMECLDLKT